MKVHNPELSESFVLTIFEPYTIEMSLLEIEDIVNRWEINLLYTRSIQLKTKQI